MLENIRINLDIIFGNNFPFLHAVNDIAAEGGRCWFTITSTFPWTLWEKEVKINKKKKYATREGENCSALAYLSEIQLKKLLLITSP